MNILITSKNRTNSEDTYTYAQICKEEGVYQPSSDIGSDIYLIKAKDLPVIYIDSSTFEKADGWKTSKFVKCSDEVTVTFSNED